ncbi:MAG: MMPL family transporter [Firmicutes bacterium]|nr:MMPL family transporter [Bacillota bacterium]
MIRTWTRLCVRYRWLVVVAWLILIIATVPLAVHVSQHLTSGGFSNPHSEVTWATNQIQKIQAAPAPPTLLVEGVSIHQAMALGRLSHLPLRVFHRISFKHTLLLPTSTTTVHQVRQFERMLRQHGGRASNVSQAALATLIKHDTSQTITHSGLAAMPVLAVLLLFVFGSVAAVLLPLMIAVAGSELALAAVAIISRHVQLSVFLTDIVSFLALGVGIDYSLFISTRFRHNLDQGEAVEDAIMDSMGHAGRSVLYSGIAVALAVGALLLGDNAYWRGLAIGGSVAIFADLLATHSLLPAVMAIFGRGLYWGRIRIFDWHVWKTIGRWVTTSPLSALAVGLVLLLPLATYAPQIHMRTPANLATMLPTSDPLRQAVETQQAINGPGSIAPIAVAMRLSTTVQSSVTWDQVAAVTRHVQALPDVESVDSPTLLNIPPTLLATFATDPTMAPEAVKSALTHFITPTDPHLVVIYVTAKTGPNSVKTGQLANRINQDILHWLPPHSRAAAGGQVPILQSFNQLTAQRLPIIILAAVIVAIVLLTLATGSIVQAFLGVVFDGLVALATAGFLVLVVHHGLFGFQNQPLDSSVTPLIFVLLFGLSMDYEVILLHRIQEPMNHGESTREAVYHGVSTTGSMITGAGMIMVIVFLALLISPLQVMKTIGVGLSFAVLADTWLVRSLLVPSTTVLLNRLSFWPWKPVKVVRQD